MSQTVNLVRDGTNQLERLLEALKPGFVQLEERQIEQLLDAIHQLTTQFIFYNLSNQENGDWQAFFPPSAAIAEVLKTEEVSPDLEPHLALLVTFIKLLGYAQQDLNKLTQKHLEFFYKKVLHVATKAPVQDQVHIYFELNKNTTSHELKENTPLDAGKDGNGNPVVFTTNRRLIINSAKIVSLKSLFFDRLSSARIYAAPVANSADGFGAKFSGDQQDWNLFGPNPRLTSDVLLENLENKAGMAIASPMYLLSEGKRTITTDLVFIADAGRPTAQNLTEKLELKLSGEKTWISPTEFSAQIIYEDKNTTTIFSDTPLSFPTTPDVVDGEVAVSNPDSFSAEGDLIRSTSFITTSSSGGTTTVTSRVIQETYTPKLRVIAVVNATQPAIMKSSFEGDEQKLKAEWPVWHLSLKKGQDASAYSFLRNLKIRKAQISTKVEGLSNLYLNNDFSQLDGSKSFLPFGALPAIGASFYLGHEEIAKKQITGLDVNILWDQLPASTLENHYYSYDRRAALEYATAIADPPSTGESAEELALRAFLQDENGNTKYIEGFNAEFKVAARLRFDKQWVRLGRTFSLFGADALEKDATGDLLEQTISLSESLNEEALEIESFTRKLEEESFSNNPNTAKQGYLNLILEGPVAPINAFGHSDFARVNTEAAVYNANPDSTGEKPTPKPPYTPSIKTISLDYEASHEVSLVQEYEGEQFFHIEPFGNYQLKKGITPSLFSDLKNEGNLFIGLKDFTPPQTISFLFQLVDGNATPGQSLSSEIIQWSYLAENVWEPIERENVLVDTTKGFQTSGVIELLVGQSATSNNTRMPDGLFWIKASVAEGAASANFALQLHTQAVTATRLYEKKSSGEQTSNDKELELLLLPETIKKLKSRIDGIKKVYQPYASFGGKLPEPEFTYYNRVSERLRHKQRAVTYWDYERLVLEAFPSIFKAKCLPHSMDDNNISPGDVTMVIISNLRRKNAPNPFRPKSNTITITEVKEYLSRYISPFVKVKVENPVYESMLLDFKVAFMTGFDPGFYSKHLNDEIKRFLSPWAFAEGEDIVLGGRINRSDILTFVETREYVNYVNDFDLYHLYEGENPIAGIGEVCVGVDMVIRGFFGVGVNDMIIGDSFVVGEPVEEAIASTPKSVLVTASDHRIKIIESDDLACSSTTFALGIGFMRIGADFIVGNYDYAIGNAQIVPLSIGGNPALTVEPTLPEQYKIYDISELQNSSS